MWDPPSFCHWRARSPTGAGRGVGAGRRPSRARLAAQIVLGSAVFATNRGHKNLELTVRLVKDGNIWLPSPLRLLRLLAGRACELKAADGKQCCGRLDLGSRIGGQKMGSEGSKLAASERGVWF